MTVNWTALVPLLAVVWPLLLACGLVTPPLRRTASRLLPSAALPALAAAFLPAVVQVPLPGLLLGSALVLDGTGRVFLLLNALLWLAGGALATLRHRVALPSGCGVLLLLAMAGTMGMALAADALLFLAFSTMTGYSLLGLLICQGDGPSRRAGAFLVALLVISDLLLYELFLHLAYEAGGTDFAAFRGLVVESHSRELSLGLLIAGLGIKTGMAGLHFWLPPSVTAAAVMMRPVLVSFILTAGILVWVRMLPLGDAQWTGAGNLLCWLGAITVGYAVLAGGRGRGSLSFTPYAAMAMNGVWLAVMGIVLSYPQLRTGAEAAAWPAVLQAGWALTAWMLLEAQGRTGKPLWPERWSAQLTWLAVLLLAASPLNLTAALHAEIGPLPFLSAVAALLLIAFVASGSRNRQAVRRPADCAMTISGGMALQSTIAVLLIASLLSAMRGFSRLSPADCLHAAWMLPAAALLAWLLRKPLMSALRVIPIEALEGDFLLKAAAPLQSGLEKIGARIAHWRDRLLDRIGPVFASSILPGWLGAVEAGMTRWRNALALILMAILVAVGWSWGR